MVMEKTDNTENTDKKFNKWFRRWSNFSFNDYCKDFTVSTLYRTISIGALLYLFKTPIKTLLDPILIDTIFKYIPQTVVTDFLILLFSLIGFLHFLKQLKHHVIPTCDSLVLWFFIFLIYFFIYKIDDSYQFYHFSILPLSNYTLSTVSILSISMLAWSYKSYILIKPSSKPTTLTLIEDIPSLLNKDIYNYTSYASQIASHIKNTTTETSFAIAVTGQWGVGKSDFLKRLKSELEKSDDIVFEFNPWRVSKSDAIIEEFFKALSKQLKPYNHAITGVIKEYSERILKSAKEIHFKFLDALINDWILEEDLQKKYDIINQTIRLTSKRFIIFIDDLDRLTSKEIMEVLRLIRNTASFSNTFFIVAIDQHYTTNVLKNSKDLFNEEEYLKKIFQLTITLPTFKRDIFYEQMKKYLVTEDLDIDSKEKLEQALAILFDVVNKEENELMKELFHTSYSEPIVFSVIENMRDLKRFCNSFKIAYNLLRNEIELQDLIILELIRNKNIEIYESIRNMKSINQVSANRFEINSEFFNNKFKDKNISEKEQYENVVKLLITNNADSKNEGRFALAHNFYIYFSYQLFNLISLSEFKQTLSKNTTDIVDTFRTWIKNGKEKELSQLLDNISGFKDADELQKIAITLLAIGNSKFFNIAFGLLISKWNSNLTLYFNSNKELQEKHLFSVLDNNLIANFTRASFAKQLLSEKLDNNVKEILSREKLKSIIKTLFEDYLDSKPNDHQMTKAFFMLNAIDTVDSKFIIDEYICKKYKDYLLTNESAFEGFLKIIVGPYYYPYSGLLAFDAFLIQIFPNIREFKEHLDKFEFVNIEMNQFRAIILPHLLPYFENQVKPFTITDKEDFQFVNDFLKLKLDATGISE